ncbi:YcgL domain-containing protein [Salinispirillum sp. LH 10-3-1]|uniref:YcgL domain-containing protein NFC81_07070 n=1 Tax=Salinispirillum sp. LH 10-3-1 TaxID=2952525 RepID=A0AB38YK42_9GAMM
MTKQMISIYKSSKRDETYVYVLRKDALTRVPEELLELFGKPIKVTDMLLTPERKLARAKAETVLLALDEQGFYLQMPPPKEPYLLDLYRDTSGRYEGL